MQHGKISAFTTDQRPAASATTYIYIIKANITAWATIQRIPALSIDAGEAYGLRGIATSVKFSIDVNCNTRRKPNFHTRVDCQHRA